MDVLTLGGISFTGFSTPDEMMGGGRQAMVVHKLPGGARVVDTLGPDEASIAWHGKFYQNNALGVALTLDAMRAAGNVLPLTWGGMFRSVIIDEFIYKAKRLPMLVEYKIVCIVVNHPALGGGGAIPAVIDSLIVSDLALAVGL
jgi:hypothetical protein